MIKYQKPGIGFMLSGLINKIPSGNKTKKKNGFNIAN